MKIRDKIREKVTGYLKKISHMETNHLYRKGELDEADYISRIGYPQTWWMKKYIPLRLFRRWYIYKGEYYRNPLYYILTGLCGLLTGHEKSATEYGYGGGDFVDRNCRWCDKVILEPIGESRWARESELSDLIAEMQNGQVPTLEE